MGLSRFRVTAPTPASVQAMCVLHSSADSQVEVLPSGPLALNLHASLFEGQVETLCSMPMPARIRTECCCKESSPAPSMRGKKGGGRGRGRGGAERVRHKQALAARSRGDKLWAGRGRG